MNIAPSSHHPLSPSKFPAWALCPSFDAIETEEDGDAKSRGSAQHVGLAMSMTGQPDAFAGLSDDEEQEVRWVAEKAIEDAASMGYQPSEIRIEQRLTLFGGGFEELYFGTCDIEYGPVICDAKFGDPRNYFAQLCGYALAKMERDGLTTIFAKAYYGRWRKVVAHTIDKETAERVVYGILAKRQSPNRTPVICEFCSWCQHKATCSALTAPVDAVLAKRDDWAVRMPTMSATEAGADPVVLGAMRWLWKTWVEPWGKGVEYATNVMAECGNTPLGFKKQDEKGRLDIHDPAKVFAALTAAGVPREAIEAAAGFTMKDLAEAYQQATGCPKTAAPAKVEALLVASGAAARGPATFKLIRQPGAEDEIRAALARPVNVLSLPNAELRTNLTEQQGTTK